MKYNYFNQYRYDSKLNKYIVPGELIALNIQWIVRNTSPITIPINKSPGGFYSFLLKINTNIQNIHKNKSKLGNMKNDIFSYSKSSIEWSFIICRHFSATFIIF